MEEEELLTMLLARVKNHCKNDAFEKLLKLKSSGLSFSWNPEYKTGIRNPEGWNPESRNAVDSVIRVNFLKQLFINCLFSARASKPEVTESQFPKMRPSLGRCMGISERV